MRLMSEAKTRARLCALENVALSSVSGVPSYSSHRSTGHPPSSLPVSKRYDYSRCMARDEARHCTQPQQCGGKE